MRTSPPNHAEGLVQTIAKTRGVEPENILPGGGSSPLIFLAFWQWLKTGSRVLLLGMAYKKDIDDIRESPALDVMRLLEQRGAEVRYHDVNVPRVEAGISNGAAESVELTDDELRNADCVVITTAHSTVDYARVVRESKLILDTRNATKGLGRNANVVKL